MGGDWYCRAFGDAIFELPKPNKHKGIGFDSIPYFIKADERFTKNELARLANVEKLPEDEDINLFKKENPSSINVETAKSFLNEGKINEAWMCLLA